MQKCKQYMVVTLIGYLYWPLMHINFLERTLYEEIKEQTIL